MKLTPPQRKALWSCAGLYAASYPVRWAVDYSRQVEFYQQQAIRAAQQRARAKPHSTKAAPGSPAPPAAAAPNGPASAKAPSPAISGTWEGAAAIASRGLCALRVEIKDQAPDVTGYAVLACGNLGLLSSPHDSTLGMAILNKYNPAEAILTGARADDGSIRFHLAKTIGADNLPGRRQCRSPQHHPPGQPPYGEPRQFINPESRLARRTLKLGHAARS
jgi:hypothetical protein